MPSVPLITPELRNLLTENSADQMKAAPKIEELGRRILFSSARERFEQAAAQLAVSDGKIDHDMLDADEMVVVETYGPTTT
jgi:hypothetical protein